MLSIVSRSCQVIYKHLEEEAAAELDGCSSEREAREAEEEALLRGALPSP